MRVPCLVRWPGHIPARQTSDQVASTLDLLPTFAGLAGAAIPDDRHIDGGDIWPLLSGTAGARSPHDAFFYYYRDRLEAVRSGQWKLHLPGQRNLRGEVSDMPLRLYDLDSDIREQENVADQQPEVVQRLLAAVERARQDLGDGKNQGENQRPAGFVGDPKPLTH